MDFVVVGFGLGALAVVLGLALRDLGPRLRPVHRNAPLPWAEIGRRLAWARICRSAGLVGAFAGGGILAFTLAGLVGRAGDRTGNLLLLLAGLFAAVGIAAWAGAYAWRRAHPRRPFPLALPDLRARRPQRDQPARLRPTPRSRTGRARAPRGERGLAGGRPRGRRPAVAAAPLFESDGNPAVAPTADDDGSEAADDGWLPEPWTTPPAASNGDAIGAANPSRRDR